MNLNWAQLAAAAVVSSLGMISWMTGNLERRLADADETLGTFGFAAASTQYESIERSLAFTGRLPWLDGLFAEVREHRASAAYWQSRQVAPDKDPQIMFVAANSDFREGLSDRDRQRAIGQLDQAIRKYAEVLKNRPEHFDAAYDFEYASRLRAALAKSRSNVDAVPPLTPYGKPGQPPEESDMKQFKMLIPKEPEERAAGPREAGKGQKKVRKG